MITAKLVDGDKLVARLERLYPATRGAVFSVIQQSVLELAANVKAGKLSGQVLNVRTGRLRRSITTSLESSQDRVIGIVSTNVKYGVAWEYGFRARVGAGAHGGPKNLAGKALERYFQKHPSGTKDYPARSFLRSTLAESQAKINQRMNAAIGDAVRKALL